MQPHKKFIQYLIPLFISYTYGINPPQSGQFPIGFWDQMEAQDIGFMYGDSGWVKKIAEWRSSSQRDAQLEFGLPVLLGKYSGATTYFSAQDFQDILFDNNPTGSMSEYYDEISHGSFTVDGTAGGWYQSSYSMSEAKTNTRQYVAEIAALADPDFDYSQYDNDGPDNIPNSGDDDGYVDGIAVVYSGCGAEWSPGNDNLWPHMSSLGSSYEYTTGDASANGGYVIVSSYFVSPELAGGGDCYTDIIRPMGVYAHEFGHILGLPDLYDRDDSNGNSEGIGNWCLMAGGSWNGWAGDTPAHMSAWCKQEMGWVEPTILSEDQTGLDIPESANNPYALKIWEDDYAWSRYFLVENRQLTGFDAGLPASGLMVYHIDENRRWGTNRWSSGTVNDDHTHKLVDIEAADGNGDMDNGVNRGDGGDPFPGTSNNTDFSSNSDPNSNRYSGEATSIVVTNISSSSSTMMADIAVQAQKGIPIVYDQTGISGYGWGYSSESDHYGGVLFEYSSSEDQNGYLTEVDIGFRNDNNNYTLFVYDSFDNGTPGTLLFEVSGNTNSSGWHSVAVDSVMIQPGQEFFVAYKLIAQSYAISFDRIAEPVNRSFFSGDGVSYSSSIGESYNINLRAKLHNRSPQDDILGCTDPYASNYDPDATSDDGSCSGYPDNGDYSLSFDGVDDYTRAAWSNNMNTYTVSLWVRSNVESQELYRGFFNSYDNQSYGFQLDCNGSNQYRFISDLGSVVFAPLSTEWSHISVVANNSTTSFYFNGDLIATENWVMDEWNHIELGRNRSTQQPGNYTVDQVSIWNTARSQTEIQSDMYNEHAGNEDGLLVYWKGDAGEGDILYDHTGNANHATIYGAEYVNNNPTWPVVDIDPDSLYEYLLTGDSITQTLTIVNNGDADLIWEIEPSSLFTINNNQYNNIFTASTENVLGLSSDPREGAQDPLQIQHIDPIGSHPSGRDGDLQVLLMSNKTSDNDYFAGQIDPYVENIDFASWDIDQTPQLTYLQQFDVILLQENGRTSNSAYIGDILAEYVLDGGNLILSTFYWQDRTDGGGSGWGDLELYDPLYGGACNYANQDLGTVLDHPMTEGIEELTCYFRGGPTTLRDDATAVAWWSDGDPLVAYNQPGGVITAVTTFPAHGYYTSFSGDFYELFSNAIYWTANASPGWLSTDIVSGTVSPGASQDIVVSLNASELDTGYYTAQLVLNSNDPIDPSVSIPVDMEVYMLFPDIDISPDQINEELYLGDTSSQTLTIYNNGEADLDWSSLIISGDEENRSGSTYRNTHFSRASNVEPYMTVEEAVSRINERSRSSNHISHDTPIIRAENEYSTSSSIPVARTVYNSRNTRSLDVAVLFADYELWGLDISNKLIATDQFNSVTAIQVNTETPTTEELSAFSSVLIWSDYNFANATDMGNNLADYVDMGGGVVCAMFAVGQVPILGRFSTEEYWVIDPASSISSTASIGTVHEPDHPIMNNVGSIDGCVSCQRPSSNTLSFDATRVADWSDGYPLVATKDIDGVHRVDLGLFPPTTDVYGGGWDPNSDVVLLMANTLTWVSGQTPSDWFSYSPDAGNIPPGSSQDIQIEFNSLDIEGGIYSTQLAIMSNDQDESEILIPVELIANIPYPDIAVTPGSLDDNLFLGDSSLQSIMISNSGVADLNWNLNILDYGRDGMSYVFTNCGGEGHIGPSQEDCNGAYQGTALESVVDVIEGIQEWTVPQTGLYTIEALGAEGGGVNGGLGARMSGNFELNAGDVVKIQVGQMGIEESSSAGGGGGASAVVRTPYDTEESIMIIAAGGGGGGYNNTYGGGGIIEETGSYTGSAGYAPTEYGEGNSGAGFFGNGVLGGHNGETISYSFINGAVGGIGASGGGTGYGGFGGGGSDGHLDGGGGGGYSGGRGGPSNQTAGYGGSSFNSGDDQDNEAGIGSGHGLVIITLDSPSISWVSTSENSGVIPVGYTDTIDVSFNASDLEAGNYLADLVIYSDDPDESEVNIPLSLSVFDQLLLDDIPDTSLNEDSELYLALDADYPGYEYNFSVTSDTVGVEASLENDSLLLLPAPDWTGNAAIEVVLTLENSLSDTASFVVTIDEVNDPPNAYDHIYYIDEDDSLFTMVPADDGDSLNGAHDEQSLTFLTLSAFTHGSFDLGRTDGVLSYMPNTDYYGPDSMEYVLMDDGTTSGQSDPLADTALIVVNTLPINDDPILESLSDTSMYEDSTLSIVVSASDIDNEDLSFQASSSIDEYITAEMIDTVLYLNSNFNWYGTATITVLVNDNMGRAVDVEEFQLTVLPVNDPPAFEDLFALVGVGSNFEIPISANDIDMDSLSILLDDSFDYPDWVTLECEPCRLVGNAPDEGNYHFPLLVHDGSTTVSDTFNLESRYFQPRITSVDDVPEDEGGRVYVEFQRSFFDHADQNNQFYTIFRLDQVEDSTLWVSTVTGAAGGDETYVFEVSTVVDSSGEDNGITQFKVIGFMNAGTFESDISTGYSLDNLAPEAPTGLEVVVLDEGIHLSWNLSGADDFQHFDLDKSLSDDFADHETFTLTDTVYLDPNYTLNETQYYRLSAIDHSGNVSGYSDIVEAAVLAIDEEVVPDSYALYQNYPNPFNPVTTIRYDLPERAFVSIRIFDIKGRIVQTLVQGTHDPGRRVVVWDATNQNGEDVSAGMYMYMIQAGKFSQVRKMLLLK